MSRGNGRCRKTILLGETIGTNAGGNLPVEPSSFRLSDILIPSTGCRRCRAEVDRAPDLDFLANSNSGMGVELA